MENEGNINTWFQQLADAEKRANKYTLHIVVGYGSLLSKQSRDKHSNIRSLPLPVTVNGWERDWVTSSDDEKQTYVSACPNASSSFNAHTFYTNIDEQLLQREQDYRFSKLQLYKLNFGLEGRQTPRC